MTGTGRTAHSATQAFGLTLVAAALLAGAVLTIIVLDGEDLLLPAAIALVATVSAIVAWRFDKPWARILGIAGTVISLAMSFYAFGVFQPFSPVEFVLGLAYLIGMILAIVGGIRAIRAGRKGHLATAGGRRLQAIVLGAIGVGAVVSVVGFALTRTTVAEADAAGAIVVTMSKFEFDPSAPSVAAGGSLLVHNADPFTHDLTIEALGIDVVVGPGSDALVELSSAASGTYPFVCTIHSVDGDGMVGTLTIEG